MSPTLEQLAFENGTPLYQRDVHKTDQQDDNAAARLFSAPMFKFLFNKHPEYLSEIIYLFIFGKLMPIKILTLIIWRIKLVLQAQYFIDAW